jgi:two-component system, sensor histidine kinase PdtaS
MNDYKLLRNKLSIAENKIHFLEERIKSNNIQLSKFNQSLLDERKKINELNKELTHRVNHNLQIITCLLSMQSDIIKNEETNLVFKNYQRRVNTIALAHKILYHSESIVEINYKKYISSLCESVLSSFGNQSFLKIDIVSPDILIKIETAIPLGLVINEFLIVPLQYALFNEKSTVSIKLNVLNDEELILNLNYKNLEFCHTDQSLNALFMSKKLIGKLCRQLFGKIEGSVDSGVADYNICFQN